MLKRVFLAKLSHLEATQRRHHDLLEGKPSRRYLIELAVDQCQFPLKLNFESKIGAITPCLTFDNRAVEAGQIHRLWIEDMGLFGASLFADIEPAPTIWGELFTTLVSSGHPIETDIKVNASYCPEDIPPNFAEVPRRIDEERWIKADFSRISIYLDADIFASVDVVASFVG